jgi:energy-coupling factor transporter ATP-binding protein EcfA2
MEILLQFVKIEAFSFCLGLLSGLLFFWIFIQLKPILLSWTDQIWQGLLQWRLKRTSSGEVEYRLDVLRYVQQRHLMALYGPLDRLFVQPDLFFPPPCADDNEHYLDLDTSQDLLPFLPDSPEIATAFGYPGISISEAISQGASIVLVAPNGCGKSVVLCHLASLLARQDLQLAGHHQHLPVYLKATSLAETDLTIKDPVKIVVPVISPYLSPQTRRNISAILRQKFQLGLVMILLDELELLSREQIKKICAWIHQTRLDFPNLQFITGITPGDQPPLLSAGFQPAGLLIWDRDRKRQYIGKFASVWRELESAPSPEPQPDIEVIYAHWFNDFSAPESPLSFSLRTWGFFANLNSTTDFAKQYYDYLVSIQDSHPVSSQIQEQLNRQIHTSISPYSPGDKVAGRLSSLTPSLAEFRPSEWLQAADSLKYASIEDDWVKQMLPAIIRLLNRPELPRGFRLQLISRLAASRLPGLSHRVHRLLSATDAESRLVAAFYCGFAGSPEEVERLKPLLNDPQIEVNQAAILALGAIGNQTALELVAGGLLHHEEQIQKVSAETLAQDPGIGREALLEGSVYDQFLVRKATIYGLQKSRQKWALESLRKMHVDDPQWVVQTAAERAIQLITNLSPLVPQPRPPLHNQPWLVEFASQFGIGISNTNAAEKNLRQILRTGSSSHKLLALEQILHLDDSSEPYLQALQDCLGDPDHRVRNAAYSVILLKYPQEAIELPQLNVN